MYSVFLCHQGCIEIYSGFYVYRFQIKLFHFLLSLEAEEYQKLGFPASEFFLSGLLPEEELKLWAAVPRMVEFVFNSGRNGWTEEMIENFRRLFWRYWILYEEQYGAGACVINLHNLDTLT